MLSGIFAAIGGALQVAATWFKGYADPKTTEARRINDEQARLDSVREAIRNGDIDKIRDIYSGGAD